MTEILNFPAKTISNLIISEVIQCVMITEYRAGKDLGTRVWNTWSHYTGIYLDGPENINR